MNELLGAAFRLYGKYLATILGLVLTIGLPCQMLSSYVAYQVFGKTNLIPNFLTDIFIELAFGIVVTGGILHALFVDRMGRRATLGECISEAINHWLHLCWTSLLVTCLTLLATTLFFFFANFWPLQLLSLLPAMLVAIRLCLAVPLVMTEGEWGVAALRRSAHLTIEKSWQILGLLLFIFLPIQVLRLIGVGMLQTNPQLDNWPVTAAFGTLLKLAACIIPVCFFLLYEKIIEEDRPSD